MNWRGWNIEVTVRRNCRRMILRAKAEENRLCLSVPPGVRKAEVERFLASQEGWIAVQMAKRPAWQPAYQAGEKHPLFGAYVTLGEGGVPAGEKAFRLWQVRQLEAYILRRLPVWEAVLGVHAGRLRLREMTSRWGSCQPKTGAITLNLRLAALPAELTDGVIAHELCHLRHADHSASFYRTLESVQPDWRTLRLQLRQPPLPPLAP